MTPWSPRPGEIISADLSPTAGTEQAGRHPALVISNAFFNVTTGRIVILPITSTVRGFMFEVILPVGLPVTGVILPDQIRTIDWRARFSEPLGFAPAEVLEEARAKVAALLGMDDQAS